MMRGGQAGPHPLARVSAGLRNRSLPLKAGGATRRPAGSHLRERIRRIMEGLIPIIQAGKKAMAVGQLPPSVTTPPGPPA